MTTVLVVDDSEVDRRLAGACIEKAVSATVSYASNGREALEYVSQHYPDIVVTDLQMPEVDGLELTATIKREHPLIPVILTTSQGSEEIASKALQIGAASYVPKRRLAEDLAETVNRVLAAARKDRNHSQITHYLSENESVFRIHNDLVLIRELVAHVQELLRCLPLGDETERLRVGIALEEALKNAYYHGNLEVGSSNDKSTQRAFAELAAKRQYEPPYCDRRIIVRTRITRDEAIFTVSDEGLGFDTSKLPGVSDAESYDDASGKGVVLMCTIMDEVKYNEKGNEVTLVKQKVDIQGDDASLDEQDETALAVE